MRVSATDTEARTVYPDIIVHRRGSNEENLLIIEAKKTTSTLDARIDYQKLSDFKADPKYRYQFGLFMLFEIGTGAASVKLNWI